MLKYLVGIAGTVLLCGPAVAAPSNSGRLNLTGDLAPACLITAPAGKSDINVTATSQQTIGDVHYQCNFIGTAGLKFYSLNGGKMVLPPSAANGNTSQSLAYTAALDSDSLGQLGSSQPASNSTTRTLLATNTDQTASLKITLGTTASVAGTYSDTIYMSINP